MQWGMTGIGFEAHMLKMSGLQNPIGFRNLKAPHGLFSTRMIDSGQSYLRLRIGLFSIESLRKRIDPGQSYMWSISTYFLFKAHLLFQELRGVVDLNLPLVEIEVSGSRPHLATP